MTKTEKHLNQRSKFSEIVISIGSIHQYVFMDVWRKKSGKKIYARIKPSERFSSLSLLLWSSWVCWRPGWRLKTYLLLIFCSCFTELSGKYSRGFSLLCWVSTLGNLAIISRDRFLALSKPWWYRNHVTRSRVVKQAILVWISAGLLAISIFASFDLAATPAVFAYYLISLIVIVYSYIGIFIANKRQRRAVHQHGAEILAVVARERKLANTVGLILIVLCLTFLPALWAPLIFWLSNLSSAEYHPFRFFIEVFLTLNGFLNPLLNFGRNKSVRRAVFDLIKRCN